jgi:uncharacterized protein
MTRSKNTQGSRINRLRVLLFIRVPEIGRVKTRLAKRIDTKTTLALYRCFVEDTMETLAAGGYGTTIFFTPAEKGPAVQAWLPEKTQIQPQTGKNLGQRMRNAFLSSFATRVDKAVLMGSDFPDLDIRIIHEAFFALKKKDVVIGPARDGGYYLIGFWKSAFRGDVFRGVDWGTDRVFQQTLGQIRNDDLRMHTLPVWQDIDTYEDLLAFYGRNTTRRRSHLKTMKLLDRYFLKGSP